MKIPVNTNILPKRALMILVFTIFTIASGCGNKYKIRKLVDNLDTAITNYDVSLRWAQYQNAYDYHISPDGAQPPADLERLKEISVAGIKHIEKTLSEDHTEATVRSVITYFFKDQGTLREIRLEQRWWNNKTTGKWHVDGQFPDFFQKSRM